MTVMIADIVIIVVLWSFNLFGRCCSVCLFYIYYVDSEV